MEVHNARLKFASTWQLPGIRRAENRIDNSHRTTPRDYTYINSVEAHGSPFELRPRTLGTPWLIDRSPYPAALPSRLYHTGSSAQGKVLPQSPENRHDWN